MVGEVAGGGPGAPGDLKAQALRQLGVLMELRRELDRAAALFEEALEYFKASGNRPGEAACLNSLGVVARSRHDPDAAEALLDSALSLRRELHDASGISTSLSNLGIVAFDRGDVGHGMRLLEEAMEIDRTRGDEWAVACSALNLGVGLLELHGPRQAKPSIEDALRTFARVGDPDGTAEGLESLAAIALGERDPVKCVRLAAAAGELRRRSGIPPAEPDRRRLEARLEQARAALGEEAYARAWGEGLQMNPEETTAYALGPSGT